jgi:hypothetical protein
MKRRSKWSVSTLLAPSAALLFAGCTPGPRLSATPDATAVVASADTAASVVVSPTEARIVVPLSRVPAGPWHWNLASTPDNQLEYQWIVSVPGREGIFDLGYTTFKMPGSKPRSGNLRGLVREGGVQVFLESQSNVETVGADTGIPLRVEVEPDRLVFVLRGRDAVQRVFGLHPGQATVSRMIATEQLPDRPVPIVYTTPRPDA